MKNLIILSLTLGLCLPALSFELLPFDEVKFEKERCETDLGNITQFLDQLDDQNIKEGIQTQSEDFWLKKAFLFKLALRDKLISLNNEKNLTKSCANAFRETFRALRTLEDLLEEHQVRHNPSRISHSSFTPNNQSQINPNFGAFNIKTDLQSGDILMTRGNAFTSAAISSLGDHDTQFSHMSLVYKNAAGVISTIEAHIEIGVVAKELQAHIDENNSRMMVFRSRSPEQRALAAKAAELMYKKAKLATATTGNINYDFGMTMANTKELFCSEVISLAFEMASGGTFQVPMFKSLMKTRKVEFVNDLGIQADESFVPEDLEIDPRFDVILEWKDATRITDLMNKDAILHTVFELIEYENYSLRRRTGWNAFLYRNIAYPLRRIPGLNKKLIEKFPLNMSRKLLGLFAVLDDVGGYLIKVIEAKNAEVIKGRDIPLLECEKREILIDYIKNGKNKKLRNRFRPK